MREILFRGKSTDTKEWVIGDHLKMKFGGEDIDCIVPYGALVDILLGNTVGRVDTETLGQFTGLTDKNGVKIFEGDILKYLGELFFVEYDEDSVGFLAKKPNGICTSDVFYYCEIVGNVHDNPELLKGD